MRRALCVLIPLTLIVAACGDDDTAAPAAAESDGHDSGGHDDNSDVADGARTVEVTATSFEFDPAEIHASVDEDVAIELTAEDITHDFAIDELDAHVLAETGETETGGFNTGSEPGTYVFYCSVPGHREAGMEGELIVE
jgi:heme/copper-type cytochrome/quinol oxidase subunit 2